MIIIRPGSLGNGLPMTLGRGESATFTMYEEDSVEDVADYWNGTVKWGMDGNGLAKSLRGQVHTTLNHTKTIKPEKRLLEHIRQYKTESP